jgi:hypothetical protein
MAFPSPAAVQVFAAQDAGLVQLQSFYVDGSSMNQSSFLQQHRNGSADSLQGNTGVDNGGNVVPWPAGSSSRESHGQPQQQQHSGPAAVAAARLSPSHVRDVGLPKVRRLSDDVNDVVL